jgi:hypothetical protein
MRPGQGFKVSIILKDFFNTTLDDFQSMEEYLNKVKALVDDLRERISFCLTRLL